MSSKVIRLKVKKLKFVEPKNGISMDIILLELLRDDGSWPELVSQEGCEQAIRFIRAGVEMAGCSLEIEES